MLTPRSPKPVVSLAVLVMLSAALACSAQSKTDQFGASEPGSADNDAGDGGGAGDGGDGGEEGDGSGGDDDGDGDGGDDGGGMPKFDLPVPDFPIEPEWEGCGAIDLLFVVDSSGSMALKQDDLAASVPGFIAAMQTALVHVDSYHVGVVATPTEEYKYNEPGCLELGDLVTQTGGSDSSRAACGPGGTLRYADGHRFMTEADDLDATFSCAVKVGTVGGPDEPQVGAMLNALDPARNAPGACNEGFSREEDALLVVVIITDEDDGRVIPGGDKGTGGEPVEWFQSAVDLKGGLAERIFPIAIVDDRSAGPQNHSCGYEEGERIKQFIRMFPDYLIGHVCGGDFSDLLADALAPIEEACLNFPPPG